MADPWKPPSLLPGTENIRPVPTLGEQASALGNNAGDYTHGLAVGTAQSPVMVQNLIRQAQGYPQLNPNMNIMGLLPTSDQPNQDLPPVRGEWGRIGQGTGNAALPMALTGPMMMATGGVPALAAEQSLGLLGATAGETAREKGVGGLGQLAADAGMSMTPGLLMKSMIPAFVGGRARWAANKKLGRLTTDMSKIGTGEGTAVRGHGQYSAQKLGTAETYAKGLVPGAGADFVKRAKVPAGTMVGGSPLREATTMWEVAIPGVETQYFPQKHQASEWADVKSGHVYGVQHDVNPEDLLNLDVPFSEQSDSVKAALANVVDDVSIFQRGEGLDDLTGDGIYEKILASNAHDEADTLALLDKHGIPGSRFLDRGSRQQGEGSSNYVMFSDDKTYVDPARTPEYLTKGQHLGKPWRTNENPTEMDLLQRKEKFGERLTPEEYMQIRKHKENEAFAGGYAGRVDKNPMLATHQLGPDELLNADKLGGFPSPSIGVVNPLDNTLSEGHFGEITLAGGRGLADPEAGAVFPADAYSVRYPRDEVWPWQSPEQIDTVAKMNAANAGDVKGLKAYNESRHGVHMPTSDNRMKDTVGSRIAYLKEMGLPVPQAKKGVSIRDYEDILSDAMTDDPIGRKYLDWLGTTHEARGLTRTDRIIPDIGRPNESKELTLDNLVEHMKRHPDDIQGSEVAGGSAGQYGVPGLQAHASPAFSSFDDMDRSRGRLTKSKRGHKALNDSFEKARNYIDDALGWDSYDVNKADMLVEYMRTGEMALPDGSPMPDDVMEVIDEFIGQLSSGNRSYFESKPMRGVKLEEFGTAVVPEDTTPDVMEVLKRRGLKTEKYKTKAQKDKILAEQKGLFFQYLAGLAGAGAAGGATHKAITEQRANEDGSISGLPPLLQPY